MWTLILSTKRTTKLIMTKKNSSKNANVIHERYPYRFLEGTERGYIEKYNVSTKRWAHMYECDSRMQLLTAMEDINYCRWLDPDGVPCYNNGNGVVKNPYAD